MQEQRRDVERVTTALWRQFTVTNLENIFHPNIPKDLTANRLTLENRFLQPLMLKIGQDPGRSHRRPGKPAGIGNSCWYTLSGTNSSRLWWLPSFGAFTSNSGIHPGSRVANVLTMGERRYRKCGSGTEPGHQSQSDTSVVTIVRGIHLEQWYPPKLRIGNHPEGPQNMWGRFPTCPLRTNVSFSHESKP